MSPRLAVLRIVLVVSIISCEYTLALACMVRALVGSFRDVLAALEAFDNLGKFLALKFAALKVDEIDDRRRQAHKHRQEPERWPDLAGRINDRTDNGRPKDAGALVRDGIQCIECGLGAGWDELTV